MILVIFSGYNSEKGGLEAIYYKNKCYLNHLVLPTLFRPTTDNDRLYEKKWIVKTIHFFRSNFHIF